jgi:hypothetical protein
MCAASSLYFSGDCYTDNNTETWLGLSYRPSLVLSALLYFASVMHNAWPNALIRLPMITPGGGGMGFPPIDETGAYLGRDNSSASKALQDAIFAAFFAQYGRKAGKIMCKSNLPSLVLCPLAHEVFVILQLLFTPLSQIQRPV